MPYLPLRQMRAVAILAWLSITAIGADRGHAATDGDLLAYCHQTAAGAHEIYTILPDGTGNARVINAAVYLNHEDWSPDGLNFVAVGYVSQTTWSIYMFGADGAGFTRLTNQPGVWDGSPFWSPDGTLIAYTRTYPSQAYRNELWLMNRDGTNQHALGLDGFGAHWSPDGSRFVYSASPGGVSELFTCRTDGTDVVQLTTTAATEFSPTWSPDGTRIAFTSDRDGAPAIYTMDPDGSGVARVTNATGAALIEAPRWAPDGSRFAFSADISATGHWEVWLINIDGSGLQRVTTTAGSATAISPAWRPRSHVGVERASWGDLKGWYR